MKNFTSAVSGYDEALNANPKLAFSLYGRGLAKRAMGDPTGSAADIAAAKELDPEIVTEFESYGIPANWPSPPAPQPHHRKPAPPS